MKIPIKDKDGQVREALPVRAIPFVTGGSWSAKAVVTQLATQTRAYSGYNLVAYARNAAEFSAPVLAKEWDAVVAALAIEEHLHDSNKRSLQNSRESIECIPAGCFVWVDEFEMAWGEFQRENAHDQYDRPGDNELTYSPLVSPDTMELVSEGFTKRNEVLGSRERASLHAIITVLAAAAKVDLSHPYKAAEQIAKMGNVDLTPHSIGNHLKKIADAIESLKR